MSLFFVCRKNKYMRISKLLLITPLFIFLCSLSISFFVYKNYQNNLYLEVNNLYKKNTEIISSNIREIDVSHNKDLMIFKDLSGTGDVRAIKISDKSSQFPIYKGRQMTINDEKIALVGSEVALKNKGNNMYVKFDGEYFRVIGYLGTKKESLLSNQIILKDDTLFDNRAKEELILSSDKKIPKTNSKKTKLNSNILGRRTNVDYISPMILGLNIIMLVCISFLTGIIAEKLNNKYNRYLYIKGILPQKILLKNVFVLSLVFSIVCISLDILFYIFFHTFNIKYIFMSTLCIILIDLGFMSKFVSRRIKV